MLVFLLLFAMLIIYMVFKMGNLADNVRLFFCLVCFLGLIWTAL